MATPQGLLELMTQTVTIYRHEAFDTNNAQIVSEVATLPCYATVDKTDVRPPGWTAYVGIVDDGDKFAQQGDYFLLTAPSSTPAVLSDPLWSAADMQAWWDEEGAMWCQQVALDSPAVTCEVYMPNTAADEEGRLQDAVLSCSLGGGVRPLTVTEQSRAAQRGQQVDVQMRYPLAAASQIGRQNYIQVMSGPYIGTYAVVTVEQHDQAATALLRRYEPSAGL